MAEIIPIATTRVCYNLPTSIDPSVFGPEYWKAFHDLASRIPCGSCKEEAESFMSYFHDIVNRQTGKQIHDQKNFNYWNQRITNEVNKSQQKTIAIILGIVSLAVVATLIAVLIKK